MFVLYNKMREEQLKDLEYEKLRLNLEKQKDTLSEAISSQERLKTIRHDFKNSVFILASYIENNESENALQFISKVQKQMGDLENTLLKKYTPNKELNYLLSHKIHYAEFNEIKTSVECMIPEDLKIGNDIIIALLGNLLDNAINASVKIKNKSLRDLSLKLKYYDQSLFIEVKNTTSRNDVSAIKPKEGVGIKSVKKIVEKNSGIYKHFTSNGKYIVQIILWDYKGEN